MSESAASVTAGGDLVAAERRLGSSVQWAVTIGLLLIACAVYLPYAGIPYYADDFLFLSENPQKGLYEYFVSQHDMGGEFRPLQMAYNALNQIFFDEGTFALQAGQVVLHALLGGLVFRFLVVNGLSASASFLAALWFTIHPVGVIAVLSNDTFSQVGSTLLGFLSFALAWGYTAALNLPGRAAPPCKEPGIGAALGSAVALWFALLFKETGLSFAAILGLTLLYGMWHARRAGSAGAVRKLAVLLTVYVAIVGVYFVYRLNMATTNVSFGGTGPYDMRVGPNIGANEALLFAAALLPLSTVDAFVAVHQRALVTLAAMAGLVVAWAAVLRRGLLLSQSWRIVLGISVLAACATMPVALMNHVSELYAYNMAPFLAVIIALSLGALLRQARGAWRTVTVVVLLAVAASDVVAVSRKAAQMRYNGRSAARLEAQVVARARELPPNGKLLLVERPHPEKVRYSVFLTSDFHCMGDAVHWLKHLAARPDVSIQVVDEQHIGSADMIFVREDGAEGPALKPRE